ncbi:hypothetical protein COU57_01470 [Candidatus Pacearchaeota archaeon CG10_big_fil_rev_8_21_14_0_10_32_14]|nr:MAG: hypothetical protein COU57_01470 [Candidatus Pacearchaeota archaeon CG10_big_fil_rev_8_21_14_0_10_32_14]
MEENKKTKFLAIADIHNDSKLVMRLAERAKNENVDIVILAGDLTWLNKEPKNIVGPFLEQNKKVLLLHGNHESNDTINFLTELYQNTKNLHGYGMKHNDIGIFGVGGADFGIEPMTEKDFKNALNHSHSYIKEMKKKILITHMHPADTKSEFSGFDGSTSIREAIEKFQPDFALFGHIHEASGIEEKIGKTRLINVSRKEVVFEI